MQDPVDRPEDEQPEDSSEQPSPSTAERVEDWLRQLRSQRGSGGGASESGGRSSRQGGSGSSGGSSPAEDPADAFLKAVRRVAASPRAQQALARRLSEGQQTDDPALRALARVLQSLGNDLSGVLGAMGGGPGGAAVLDRPEVIEQREPRLSDGDGGGGDGDFYDDDEGEGGGGDDEEPWPSAFVGYRVGLVDSVDVGTCRDGCCTAIFADHPGLRAAVWFPTEAAVTIAQKLGEALEAERGETAQLGVPPFGAGSAPARGQVQATIQFFTEDVHLDPVDSASDRKQGGIARFAAYDQGLGHGGPALVDVLVTPSQARALRKALRRAARNAPKE